MKEMKSILEVEEQTSSSFTAYNGMSLTAALDWDQDYYYLWFYMTDDVDEILDFYGIDVKDECDELQADIDRKGIEACPDLDSVNRACSRMCGDDQTIFFYEDEVLGNICGC